MQIQRNPGLLYGLILSGGKSLRMGEDKSTIAYFGKPQVEYCYELLSQFCDKVFISNRKVQAKLKGHKGLPQIHDQKPFVDIGPLGGLLSAMKKFPKTAWFILACDLPFIDKKTLAILVERRDAKKFATAYRSRFDNLPEPLCAIFEPHGQGQLLRFFKEGMICPRKILMDTDVKLINLIHQKSLDNINRKDDYLATLKILKRKR